MTSSGLQQVDVQDWQEWHLGMARQQTIA